MQQSLLKTFKNCAGHGVIKTSLRCQSCIRMHIIMSPIEWSNVWFSWCFKVFFQWSSNTYQRHSFVILAHMIVTNLPWIKSECIYHCNIFYAWFSCWSIANVKLINMDFQGNKFCWRITIESQKNQMVVAVMFCVTCGKNETFRSQFVFPLQF